MRTPVPGGISHGDAAGDVADLDDYVSWQDDTRADDDL
jgi:hypothetical protein